MYKEGMGAKSRSFESREALVADEWKRVYI